jgi:transcriptional regulator with XRE-family HTH domain
LVQAGQARRPRGPESLRNIVERDVTTEWMSVEEAEVGGERPQVGVEESLATVIAGRVREIRLSHGWTVGRLADECGLSKSMLSKIENAQSSPSLGTLARLAEALSVPVTAFFRGLSEEQDVIHVKAGAGLVIHHRNSARGQLYQSLGTMRAPHDYLEPMLVTLTERADAFPLYQHAGTELIFMISGKMEYCCGASRYVLEAGDTLQFVGEVAHGPGDLISLPIQFLAVKSLGARG